MSPRDPAFAAGKYARDIVRDHAAYPDVDRVCDCPVSATLHRCKAPAVAVWAKWQWDPRVEDYYLRTYYRCDLHPLPNAAAGCRIAVTPAPRVARRGGTE